MIRFVGMAQTKGLLQVDQSASTWFTEWSGTARAGVTVRHLPAMTSSRTEMNVLASPNDLRGAVLATPQNVRVPGARWSSHEASSQAHQLVPSRATGEPVVAFAQSSRQRSRVNGADGRPVRSVTAHPAVVRP